jgi:hypothetical protein
MRVARALEQLRKNFQARGMALPVTLLAAALATPATQAAPLGLAATITTSALLKSTTIPLLTKGLLLFMNWNARKLAIAAIILLSLTTATTTSLLGVLLWKQSRPVAAAPVPPPPREQDVFLGMNEPADLKVTPGQDGTLRVKTPDGDFTVTNGVNHLVTTDAQGRTKEITITADENGGGARTMTLRSTRRAPGGLPPGAGAGGRPARVRGAGGPGAPGGGGFGAGAGGPGGGAIGGEVRVEEEVGAPPTPATK